MTLKNKEETEANILFIVVALGIFFIYFSFQISMYHAWVKNDAIEDFESCMIFERKDYITANGVLRKAKGEKHCLDYARNGNLFSPYPFWKAMIFINPNK